MIGTIIGGRDAYRREVILVARQEILDQFERRLPLRGYRDDRRSAFGPAQAALAWRRLPAVGAVLFVDDRPVGGLAEIRALSVSGVLEHLVREEL